MTASSVLFCCRLSGSDLPFWPFPVMEISIILFEMCNANANNAAAEAEDAYSDDDSWSQFEELFGDIIPPINSSATRQSPPVTAISRQLNQRFSNLPLNPCTPSVISQSQPSGRPFGRQPPTTHFTPAFSNYNPSVIAILFCFFYCVTLYLFMKYLFSYITVLFN